VIAPALTVSMFNLRKPEPVPLASLDLRAITRQTYGAFVLELGDASSMAASRASGATSRRTP
jgi:hypothetical protein